MEKADGDHNRDLIKIINYAVFGNSQSVDSLIHDLLRFKKIYDRQGQKGVSRAAIRLWQNGTAAPRRSHAIEFLHMYLGWKRAKGRNQAADVHSVEAFNKVASLVEELRAEPTVNRTTLSPRDVEPLDLGTAENLRAILTISSRSHFSEADYFFRGSPPDSFDDASYYLSLRHSTNHGAIVKGFFVVRAPLKGIRNRFTFKEFIGGGTSESFSQHLYRESDGLVIKMERGFYFLGSTYNIPIDKKQDPLIYSVQRKQARWEPEGIVLSSYEYDDVRLSPGLFGGVTMGVGDLAQPLVARTLMLHLGIKSLLGVELSDILVNPGEIARSDFEADLRATCESLRSTGATRFGAVIQKIVGRREVSGKAIADLSATILKMLDNTPAWEIFQRGAQEGAQESRGAIETYGSGRPRD